MMRRALLLFLISLVYAQNTTCQVRVNPSTTTAKPFAFCHSENGFQMFWTLPPGSSTVEIAYRWSTDRVWVGAGFSPNGDMDNSQVLIGWFSNGVGEVHEYQLGDHELGGLANKLGVVGSPVILSDDGHTVITYNRTINASGAIPVYSSSFNYKVYAIGDMVPSSTSDVQYHAQRDNFKVSMTTGAVAGISEGWMSYDTGKKVHGVLMGITFIFLLPLGVVIARYLKPLRPPLWFQLHRAIQWLGVLLSTFAFAVAVNVLWSTNYNSHRIIGIITMTLAFWQPLNAFIRPHPPKQGEPLSTERQIWNYVHHWSGRVCVVLGITNVYIGILDVVKADTAYAIVISVFLFVLFLVAVTLSFHRWDDKTLQSDVKGRGPEGAPFLANEAGTGADSDDDK